MAGQRYEWGAGDLMLTAPGWAIHHHASGPDERVYELTVQDQPLHIAMESLLWQEDLKRPPGCSAPSRASPPTGPTRPPRPELTEALGGPMSTTVQPMTPSEAGQVFVTPAAYADDEWFHHACAVLRREDPVHLVEHPDFAPFWVLTKHADVLEVELHPQEFRNAPRPVLQNHEADQRYAEQGDLLRTLIHMDDPDHKVFRAMTADWFLPKSIARLDGRLQELAVQAVARMEELGGTCDFARDIAMPFPLQVILAILGLPESDYPRMLTLTQELFGAADPEMARGDQERQLEALLEVINDFFAYFSTLTEQRRANPTDDLASVIANATIDGELLDLMDVVSYYVIVATAGHDTTASAMAGGFHALIENPDQLARLQADPSLIPTAVDEIIRWVTPVKHFMRNVVEPVRGARPPLRARRRRAAVVPLGQPGRGGLRRPLPLRRRPHTQQAPGLRVRRALLPRRHAGPARDQGAPRRSCSRGCARSSWPASRSSCRRCSSAA